MIQPEPRAATEAVLAGGGEMGARMRAMDWSRTPLGPVEAWPRALKTCVRILLTSRQPMWLGWGEQLTFLYNDPYRSIVGGKHPDALGQPTAVVWKEIWPDIAPRIQSALGGEEGTYDEALLLIMERHGYPEETYYTFSYSPIPDDEGRAAGIFCANTDDTRRILGERQLMLLRELAASTAEARTIQDACRLSARGLRANPYDLPFALVYLIDADRRGVSLAGSSNIARGHPAAPEWVRVDARSPWPFAEMIEANGPYVVGELAARVTDLPTGAWDQPTRQAVGLPIAPSGQTGRAGLLIAGLNPYRVFDDDYQRFLVLVAGQIAAAIANAQAYEEERQRADALAELDLAKTTFFSNVSHEFRTPLTLLLGPLEDLLGRDDGALEPDAHEQLTVAHRNALRLLRLVNTLLDFSRIEAGRVQAAYESLDLPTLTADLASTFRSAIERAGLRLVVDCPPLPEAVRVFIDREMWEKVVLNLLSNAFKHTFAGEIGVSVRAGPGGESVELAVRDTGTGIPSDELPRLFERFHRVPGAEARTHEGTGIGLALVQELVKLHGGCIRVASELGVGTTFTVAIPTGADHLPADRVSAEPTVAATAGGAEAYVEEALRWLPGAAESAEAVGQPGTGRVVEQSGPRKGRVLLADDNADMREYVARLLAHEYQVQPVTDGAAALAAARTDPPDLVLSDVMMPRLNGFELLRALRNDPVTHDVPVVLLSARAGEEAEIEGLESGADDYLVKPFSARELLARVEGRVELARVRREKAAAEQQARRASELERARLLDLFMQAPAIIAIVRGPQHVFELANPRYVQFVGGRELLGKAAREALPEVEGQGLFELLDRVYATGEAFVGTEVPVQLDRHGSGSLDQAYVNFVYEPIREDGQVTGIFVHGVEVTDQVRARERVEALSSERDAFLGAASHDLKNPLTAIRGTVQILRRRLSRSGEIPAERLAAGLETIEATSDQMLGLINELMDVTRLRMGQSLVLDLQPTDLISLARRAVTAQQAATDRHTLRLETRADELTGDWDPVRMRRVFDNLLSNAVKFSPQGGEIRVSVDRQADEAPAAGDWAVISVQDHGLGIPVDDHARIFERFARGSNVTHITGTGIGLTGVRQIVEQHGGSITVRSQEGHGTTFTIRLPLNG